MTLPCLSVREPFVELFARKLKRFEVRGRAILKRYRNQYVMMHVSRTVNKAQLRYARKMIGIGQGSPRARAKISKLVTAAAADKTRKGHVVAIVKIGATLRLSEHTMKRHRGKWERRLFVSCKKMKKACVTEIKEIHLLEETFAVKGQRGVWAQRVPRNCVPNTVNLGE